MPTFGKVAACQIRVHRNVCLSITVSEVARPIITQADMPLDIIESALPRLVGSFDGKLAIGACILDADDEHNVAEVARRQWHISFLPQSAAECEKGYLESEWYDIVLALQDAKPNTLEQI